MLRRAILATVLLAVLPFSTALGAASLTITPDPVPAYGAFHGAGCGYVPGSALIGLQEPEASGGFSVPVDTSGCLAFTWYVDGPGLYTVSVYQGHQNQLGTKHTLVVAVDFTVQ